MDTVQIPETLKGLEVDIHSLRPYQDNPNNGDVEAIKESLQAHGLYKPIVVRKETNEILAGNHTYAAALELGWKVIACTYVECDDDEARRINIVDNRLRDLSKFDQGILAASLSKLQENHRGLFGTGYNSRQFDDVLAQLELAIETPANVTAGVTYADSPEDTASRDTFSGKVPAPLKQVMVALTAEEYTTFMQNVQVLQKRWAQTAVAPVLIRAINETASRIDL